MTTQCEVVARKWGNSIGVTLPKDLVEREHIAEDEKVTVWVMKQTENPLKEMFGRLKGKLTKPTQQMKDELRRELYND